MAKHFELAIADGVFRYERRAEAIAAEAALDGLYVIRTSVGPDELDAPGVVLAYKRLAGVERDFRAFKTSELRGAAHPPLARGPGAGHLFLCLLAAYVRWHLERAWAPLLFRDEAPPERTSAVAPPERSAGGTRQGGQPPHPRRAAGPQLPVAARRAGHPHPQPGGARRQRRAGGVRDPRRGHALPGTRGAGGGSAILLLDGRVLVVGDLNRDGHSASLLRDGRVLVAGGHGLDEVRSSSEVWEPATAE